MFPGVSSHCFCPLPGGLPSASRGTVLPQSEFYFEQEPVFHRNGSSLGPFGRRLPGERGAVLGTRCPASFPSRRFDFPRYQPGRAVQGRAAWEQPPCPPPGMIKVGVPPRPIFGSPTCWQDLGLELETRCLPSGVQRDLDSFTATASSRPPSSPHVAPQAEGMGRMYLSACAFLIEQQGPGLWHEEDGSDSQLCSLGLTV